MKILAFDTSNNSASVAVSQGQIILSYVQELTPSMQAQMLIPLIESALSNAGLDYQDLDYVVTTCGPGSFTGIRIGLAAAAGISFGANIKCRSLTNFDIAYYRAKNQVKNYDKIIVLLNAYRGQLYMQSFDNEGSAPEPQMLDINEVVNILSKPKELTFIAGSGIEIIYNYIKSFDFIILPRFPTIKALHICRYADELIKQGKELRTLEPLYIRPPDAKIAVTK